MINPYMFRAGLPLIIIIIIIIMRYYSVLTAVGVPCLFVDWLLAGILPTASQHKRKIYTNCCKYRAVPHDDDYDDDDDDDEQ
jgi:hypothetical protein